MVKALILYTNGNRSVKDVKGLEEYQKIVGGNIESLAMSTGRGYFNPEKSARSELFGYANEEGMVLQLDTNPYAGILNILGVSLAFGIYLYGNIILFSYNSETGKKSAIDPYIVNLFDAYDACEDEDEFYTTLTKLNNNDKPVKKVTKDY